MQSFKFNGNWETELELNNLTKLNNPIFFGGIYSQKAKSRLDSNKVELIINDGYDDNPDPTTEQFNTIDFIQKSDDILIEKVFEKVRDEVYPFMKTMIDDREHWFPFLNTIQDLKNAVGLMSILVLTETKDNYAYFVINFHCSWDDEHGFCVLFHKDRILDWSAAWEYDFKKVCMDCGIDYEQNIKKYNSWHNEKYDFIKPNPKYGKLKPWQKRANEYYPFRLYHDNLNDKLTQDIKSGKIPKEPTCSRLLSMAIKAEKEDLIAFFIAQNPEYKSDSFIAALENDRYDLLNELLRLGYNINERVAQDSPFYSTIWELQKNIDDEVSSIKIKKRLIFLVSKGLNVYLEDRWRSNALSVIGRIDNLDKRKKINAVIQNILKTINT